MGRKGGASRSPAKVAAVRNNGKRGGPPMSRRLCRRCRNKRLAITNQSGICRTCARTPGRSVTPA